MRLTHPEPFAARWRARWIWFEPPAIHTETATRPVPSDPRDRVGLFRRTIELDVVPTSAPARLWVDGRYVLRVNGTEVARGPVRSEARSAHYDVVDLAPHLQVGANVVAVAARFGEHDLVVDAGAADLLARGGVGGVRGARRRRVAVLSDRTWRCIAGACVEPGAGAR